jgi:hypothetical protein
MRAHYPDIFTKTYPKDRGNPVSASTPRLGEPRGDKKERATVGRPLLLMGATLLNDYSVAILIFDVRSDHIPIFVERYGIAILVLYMNITVLVLDNHVALRVSNSNISFAV